MENRNREFQNTHINSEPNKSNMKKREKNLIWFVPLLPKSNIFASCDVSVSFQDISRQSALIFFQQLRMIKLK